jgi:type IV pilus assembly protein PilB
MTSTMQTPESESTHAVPSGRQAPLGSYLIAAGLATEEQVEAALEEQRQTGVRLGEILIAQGVLYDTDVARAMAEMFGMQYRDLDLFPPDPSVLSQVPEGFCRRRGVLPVVIEDGALKVAISDPRDIQTLDDLKAAVSIPMQAVVVSPSQLRRAIENGYQGAALAADDDFTTTESESAPAEAPEAEVDGVSLTENQAPVVRFVNQLFRRAVDERASDLHIEPTKEGLRIRIRVDGMLHDMTSAPASMRLGIISRVKIMTGMDIAERRRPQDGRASVVVHGLPVDIRAASLPTIDGEALIVRLLLKDQGLLDIDALAFTKENLSRYQNSFRKGWGMVLVSGPTGSGKSTTLYATVNELNVPTLNTITVEDPIEYRIAGIKQTQVNARVGYTFANGLRAALRADPDVILIGEIRDIETARIAAESALTGHLVMSTLHANDAASSTIRLMDMGLEPYLVTSALECVVAQRLLRKFCRRCRVTRPASDEELLELHAMNLIDEDDFGEINLPHAPGCSQCGQSGFRGRVPVHEVLVMNEEIKTMVLEHAPSERINHAAKVGGMRSLRQDAFTKVLSGETSLDELKRVLA